ncbi:MAG: hypothetical protein UV60_C0006G0053 [Parcubacteria group bacterium GW2011_GWA2_43_11]|nr:MAG: hypothetical protein UV60_C0006G0053 [Parcubacteria group bacterium GW2011_GWA2_43_11]
MNILRQDQCVDLKSYDCIKCSVHINGYLYMNRQYSFFSTENKTHVVKPNSFYIKRVRKAVPAKSTPSTTVAWKSVFSAPRLV